MIMTQPPRAPRAGRSRTAMRACATFAFTLALASCGGGDGPSGNDNPGPPNQGPPSNPATMALNVSMNTSADPYGYQGSYFSPANANLLVGGTVTWSNSSGATHNVVFDAATGAPADVDNLPNGTASRTFGTAGTFGYQCTNHAGMSGSIVVQ